MLGAPVTKMNDAGMVYAPAYRGWFTPIKLMPLKKGQELLHALSGQPDGLTAQRRRAMVAFDEEWDKTVFTLFPDAANPNYPQHREILEKMKNGT